MRISDWSSDVCSSDLTVIARMDCICGAAGGARAGAWATGGAAADCAKAGVAIPANMVPVSRAIVRRWLKLLLFVAVTRLFTFEYKKPDRKSTRLNSSH